MSNWSYVFKFNDLLMSTWNIPVVDKLMFWFSNCFLNFVRDLTPYHSFVVNFTSVSRLLFFIVFALWTDAKISSFIVEFGEWTFEQLFYHDHWTTVNIYFILTFPLSPVYLFHDGIPYHLETSPLILLFKSMDWFLYDRDLGLERVKSDYGH